MRPLIGITAYQEVIDRGVWRAQSNVLLPSPYADKVTRAGGIPVLIPPQVNPAQDWIDSLLGRIDGLIFAGGADVEPSRYGGGEHPSIQQSCPDRDDTELALAARSAELDLPTLGICRGMQVMAVAAGGQLIQHLPDQVAHERHSPNLGEYGRHEVATIPDTALADVIGDSATVPSYHHQAVSTAPGYLPSAYGDDGVLEGMYQTGAAWRIGVQWHPEEADDLRLFEALVDAARRYAMRSAVVEAATAP